MVRTETRDGFIYTWSDAGFMIHGGVPEGDYDLARDPVGLEEPRTYTETTTPIPADDETPTEEDYAAAGRILLGEGETA